MCEDDDFDDFKVDVMFCDDDDGVCVEWCVELSVV